MLTALLPSCSQNIIAPRNLLIQLRSEKYAGAANAKMRYEQLLKMYHELCVGLSNDMFRTKSDVWIIRVRRFGGYLALSMVPLMRQNKTIESAVWHLITGFVQWLCCKCMHIASDALQIPVHDIRTKAMLEMNEIDLYQQCFSCIENAKLMNSVCFSKRVYNAYEAFSIAQNLRELRLPIDHDEESADRNIAEQRLMQVFTNACADFLEDNN